MFVASSTVPSFRLVALTVLGGTFAAGRANAFNMFHDRGIGTVMDHAKRRPLVSAVISPAEALALSVPLEVGAFVLLSQWSPRSLRNGRPRRCWRNPQTLRGR